MSCLFNSLGHLLGQSGTTVRKRLVDYTSTHLDDQHQGMTIREWIAWQGNGNNEHDNISRYLQTMRSSSTWGGAMELAMATRCYCVDILVVNERRKVVAEFLWREQCTARVRLILEWTGVHYEPLRRIDLVEVNKRLKSIK
jgi:hypothetical protein